MAETLFITGVILILIAIYRIGYNRGVRKALKVTDTLSAVLARSINGHLGGKDV